MKVNYQILCLVLIALLAYFLLNREGQPASENAVLDNIFSRTSVRSYTEASIDDAQLELLVKAAMAAPTAGNVQPWEFVIITNKELMAQYKTVSPYAAMATTAAAAVLVMGNMEAYEGKAHMMPYWPQDTSAATQNLLLAAQSMGLGAVWTGIYSGDNERTKERVAQVQALLDLPSHKIPLAMVFLGHPDTEPLPKDKWKPEKVSWRK